MGNNFIFKNKDSMQEIKKYLIGKKYNGCSEQRKDKKGTIYFKLTWQMPWQKRKFESAGYIFILNADFLDDVYGIIVDNFKNSSDKKFWSPFQWEIDKLEI